MSHTLRQSDGQAEGHGSRIVQAVSGVLRTDDCDEVVTRSWRRCLNEYRLHPDRPRDPAVVARGAFEERSARMADVIDCARFEMTTLFQQLADSASAVVLTDTDGVIVHMVSSPEFSREAEPLGLRVGVMWSETEAGTNGMGTCLAAAAPVSVRREDHFFSQFANLTCSAVPVFDPAGKIVAALDVTSRSSHMQQHLLVLLGMTARMIENRLIDQRFRNAHPLHFHSRPELVYTLHEGKLAVAEDGRILAANRSALFQLGLKGVEDIRSRHIEDVFQTSLEDMLRRSTSSSFHPVVTYRANAAHRFFAVARLPASEAGSARPGGFGNHAALDAHPGTRPGPSYTSGSVRTPTRTTPLRTSPPVTSFQDTRLAAHLATARRVIARHTPVLLSGETGSGKEVFARAVHEGSPHAQGAFVAINCASLPENLIESELFGYRAGAFTGAQRSGRRGKILQADGGTLFLDEIGDMPLDLQARLLRVLDERQITPLGTEEVHAVDFQLLSASHRDLPALVREGRFREDLYYRLAGIELALPALRERSDKRELIRAVLAAEGGAAVQLAVAAERTLLAYSWPGNVRQLRHVLRSAAALADGDLIGCEHLPTLLAQEGAQHGAPAALAHSPPFGTFAASSGLLTASPATLGAANGGPGGEQAAPARPVIKLNPIQANERQVLLQMLEQYRWNVSNVAKALDVSRNTLYRKLHKLAIEISHPD